jgi:hypothetical protein
MADSALAAADARRSSRRPLLGDWAMLAKGVIMTGLVAVVLAPMHFSAETVVRSGANTIAPSNVGAQFTGKERLGEKWKDKQRIDNCKVPFDKRGPKPRPNSC